MMTTRVRIEVPADSATASKAITRVYTADLELVDEGDPGSVLDIPAGTGYLASAVTITGKPVGKPERFDVPEGLSDLALTLRPATNAPRAKAAADAQTMSSDDDTSSLSAESALSTAESARVSAERAPQPSSEVTHVHLRQRPDGSLAFQPSIDSPFAQNGPSPGVFAIDTLRFPGPGSVTRYGVVPHDVGLGWRREPKISWSAAFTSGLFLPVFDFENKSFTRLVAALQYGRQSAVRKTADGAVTDLANDAVAEKAHSPLTAALGFLVLLAGEPEDLRSIENGSANLFRYFRGIPDALAIRAEVLARLGRHREARAVLDDLPTRGLPWTYRGLRILVNRLAIYGQSKDGPGNADSGGQGKDGPASADSLLLCQKLLAMAHPSCAFCVFEERPMQEGRSAASAAAP